MTDSHLIHFLNRFFCAHTMYWDQYMNPALIRHIFKGIDRY